MDQLGETLPNDYFVARISRILEEAGYRVDYHSSEAVTVNFYRKVLFSRGYDLLLLRVHSARPVRSRHLLSRNWISLYTSEPYDRSKHVLEQRAGLLSLSYQESLGHEPLFGIMPEFLRLASGHLPGSVVILMGCEGMENLSVAKVLEGKGARAVVGWNGKVTASQTDRATERLVEHLVAGRPVSWAVRETMREIGPDPELGSSFVSYPVQW